MNVVCSLFQGLYLGEEIIQICTLKPVSFFSTEVGTTWDQKVRFSTLNWGFFFPSLWGSLESLGPAGEGPSFSNQSPRSHSAPPLVAPPTRSGPSSLAPARPPRSGWWGRFQSAPAGRGLGLTSREIASRGRGRSSGRLTGGVCAAAMFGCYAVAWETGCAWGRRRRSRRRRRKRWRRRRREGLSAHCTLTHKRCLGLPPVRSRRAVPLLLLAAPHCSLRTPGSPGLDSGPRSGAPTPATPLRGWISSSPQGGAGARGSPAVWGGAGGSGPWRGRCGAGCWADADGAPGAARPGLQAFLLQPGGRGWDTKVRGSGSRPPLGPAWHARLLPAARQVGPAEGVRLISSQGGRMLFALLPFFVGPLLSASWCFSWNLCSGGVRGEGME